MSDAAVAVRADEASARRARCGLEGVVKRFGDVVAVDGVDLEVREGEFFSMLGPSGSGKTTCLRMIAGFERPTEGRVLLGGRRRRRPAAVRTRREHRLPGLRAVPAHDGGRQRGLRADGAQGARRRSVRLAADEALEMVRLAGFGDRKPAQLSGGQRQRVALARALVMRPRVLLLDEPLGALDLKLRQAMQVELKEIQQAVGLTFIYVTHDQEEALTMSDRLAVFNHGRVEQVGRARPRSTSVPSTGFVAGLRGRLERARGRRGDRDRRARRGPSRSGRRRSISPSTSTPRSPTASARQPGSSRRSYTWVP